MDRKIEKVAERWNMNDTSPDPQKAGNIADDNADRHSEGIIKGIMVLRSMAIDQVARHTVPIETRSFTAGDTLTGSAGQENCGRNQQYAENEIK